MIDELRRGLSEIAAEADAVDLRDRALATSHRIRARRTVATAMTGLAVAAVALSAAVAVRTDRPPTPPAISLAPTAPSPTKLPTEQEPGENLGPFGSATITVPSWGSTGDATCTKGRVTLDGGQDQRGAGDRPVNVLSYVETDVDHDGAEDYVAHLMCGEGPEAGGSQIVAFRRTGREFVPIGRIVGTQDGFAMMDHVEARDGGRVAVLVSMEYTDIGQNAVPNQWRTYAWQNGRFRQVAGPTTFPEHPPAARLTVEPSALSFQQVGNGFTGKLTVTVRNDGALAVDRLEIGLVLPKQVQPAGAGWEGCTSRTGDGDTMLFCSVPGPGAKSHIAIPFTLVAADKPVPIDDPITMGNHNVSIRQLPPFDGQVTINGPEAIFKVNVP